MVGHDEDHGGLLLAQGHVQHKHAVLRVLVEVIQACRKRATVRDIVWVPVMSEDGMEPHRCDASWELQ